MDIEVKIKRNENQSEFYQLKLSTYKEKIEGKRNHIIKNYRLGIS